MDYVALDLETTGLDPEWDHVIEVGAVAFTPDGVKDRLERLANPGRPVPEAVLQLTGIDPQQLPAAPPSADVLRELSEFLRGRQPVGHGARIEIGFLTEAGLWPEAVEMLDTLDLARILLPGAASHSLPLLATELGLRQLRPHRALDDADATRQLLLALRGRAAALDETRKEQVLALVAPYPWPVASFFAEALTAAEPAPDEHRPLSPPAPVATPRGRDGVPDDPGALAGLLAPSGPLAASLPEYEHREGQVQMLLAVAQTMRRGGTLMVEAGTGTGKSLAYLVPALARAVKHGERVVVATHTHTLQEQLLTKDVPALQAWLPWSFEPCLLKGRANYVSLRRWRRYLAEPCRDEEELRFKLKVLLWIHETETGDRSELRLHGREEVLWAHIASDPLDCVGVNCRREDCFVHRAREEAGKADLVIVNHALLLADSQTEGGLLPPYEHLIVDEAHHLEDAATQGLRSEVEGSGVEALLERLATERAGRTGLLTELLARPRLDASSEDLAEAERQAGSARARVSDLFGSLAEWLRTRADEQEGRRDDTLRLTPDVRETPEWAQLAASAGDAATALAALDAHLSRAVSLSRDFAGGRGEPPHNSVEEPDQALRELEIVRGRLAECERLLREAFLAPDPERVYWLSAPGRNGSLSIRSAPLDVGPVLHDQVFADRRSVVLTSASLAVAGSFEFFRSRTGVTHAAESLVVESPFDYLRQALICLPTDLPPPDDEALEPLLSEVVAEVASRLGGRTLALFTSHGQLRDVYDALKQRSDVDELLFLGQGVDGQRRQILETFQTRPHGVLLGTASFWEGVDLPGDLLSCVIVVRLPFPVPSEPVYAARAERLRDPFAQYALPRAALRLKQGFGRLIRTSDDRGAVVVLDSRIVSRDYGRAFLEALPPASRFQGPIAEVGDRVQRWVEAGA